MLRKLFFELKYFGKPPWDTGVSPPELFAFIHSEPAGRALDLGCGTGTNSITLANHGWQVNGVDFVGRAIHQARKKALQAGVNVDFRIGDVTRLDDIPGQFELILDIGCLHGLSPHAKAAYIHNLERLLAPGGTFLLYAFIGQTDDQSPGLTGEDLKMIGSIVEKIDESDGLERGQRASAWFKFRPKKP